MVIIIPLKRGKETLIDDIDADLAKYKWYASASKNYYYARRSIYMGTYNSKKHYKLVSLSRTILERKKGKSLTKDDLVFYKNGNSLDNRRENLTIGTHTCVNRHARKFKNSVSKYKGVSWNERLKKWEVTIGVNKKHIYLGIYDSEIDAAKAYNTAAITYFGPCARLNIFDEIDNRGD